MPYLFIRTNQTVPDSEQETALAAISATVADALGKPERYVMVSLEEQRAMLFAGTNEPAAYVELKSIGLPEKKTGDLSATLCRQIEVSLNIPAARIYIEFSAAERHMWGWNSATF